MGYAGLDGIAIETRDNLALKIDLTTWSKIFRLLWLFDVSSLWVTQLTRTSDYSLILSGDHQLFKRMYLSSTFSH